MISVVIPVLDGADLLGEVLDAVLAQRLDEDFELLVIDSGSTDGSLQLIADRQANDPRLRLMQVDKSDFGHGRTRNLGVQNTSGDLIAFLTQDATPASDRWLAAYREAFDLDPAIGAAFGPHLPRDGVSPLMARMLTDHFATFGTGEDPVIQRPGDVTYMSNSNSCIARDAWQQSPFRDIPYAEDQAFGVDAMANGWSKAYVPKAAALHSHDYGMIESFKRHFDEYRGLSDSVGEVSTGGASRVGQIISSSVAKDDAYLKELGMPTWRRAAWAARSAVYHTGRVGFGGIGARSEKLPAKVRQAISFEGRADAPTRFVKKQTEDVFFRDVQEVERHGLTPLEPTPATEQLHVAWVVPPFQIGGGGHTTIFRMVRALERAGHRCSIWVHDPGNLDPKLEGTKRNRILDHYMPLDADVQGDFRHWTGADVVVATGWDTAYKVARLPGCGSRAYFVQDHESEFYPTGSQSVLAARTYKLGLPIICASPWVAEVMQGRYGAAATPFMLGSDSAEYAPLDMPRRSDTVVFYARHFTARRAVELGLMALHEVKLRLPGTRVVLYGTDKELHVPFAYEHIGIVDHARLRRLYNEATVGLSLSLTNYSLIPQEMMACGLPVVELAGRACEGVFGDDGSVIALADDSTIAIADRICELLLDDDKRARQSAAGLEFAREHTWDDAAEVVVGAIERVHRSAAPSATWRAGSLI